MTWAWDHSETIYHLTAHGWAKGYDSEPDPPADRVETWRVIVDQKWPWSPPYEDWHCVWASPWVVRGARDQIRSKYFPIIPWSPRRFLARRLTMHEPL